MEQRIEQRRRVRGTFCGTRASSAAGSGSSTGRSSRAAGQAGDPSRRSQSRNRRAQRSEGDGLRPDRSGQPPRQIGPKRPSSRWPNRSRNSRSFKDWAVHATVELKQQADAGGLSVKQQTAASAGNRERAGAVTERRVQAGAGCGSRHSGRRKEA